MDDSQTSRDEDYSPGRSPVQKKRPEPELSCVSMKSDCSMDNPLYFKSEEDTSSDLNIDPEPSWVFRKNNESIGQPLHFGDAQTDLSYDSNPAQAINMLRSNLRKRFQSLYEGTAKHDSPRLLSEIYTDLYITEGERGQIFKEHEVRQIEMLFRRKRATEDRAVKCRDIFKPLPGQDQAIRTVLTKGVAGIGKTVSVQKFIVDWAEGKENQEIHFLFPLPFRELNLMKDENLSLSEMLYASFPEIKDISDIFSERYKVLLIFDGLDECRLALDFQKNQRLSDVSECTSLDVLLTNLILGHLLPSALIWITSRPAAADLLPFERIHRLTEIRGFDDPQKEEYIRKKISDHDLADKIIAHLKSSRSLHIMCHIPVFCWISATVLKRLFSQAEGAEIPKTLTQMYTHFLVLQTNIMNEKNYNIKVKDEDMIIKLGKLAFQQLVKGNLIFYEEDLRECGIDVMEASVYSGLCTQIFKEEWGLCKGKVFCFVHLSIQEHLAALYVHFSFTKNRTQIFSNVLSDLSMFLKYTLSNIHQRAVDEALQCKQGHLDLFLRFLLGLSVESHQVLLHKLMPQIKCSTESTKETAEYIKNKIRTTHSPEKFINLFHCLSEMGDHSLVEEIQHSLLSEKISDAKLSSSQWSAVVFVLLTSEKKLDEFHLNQFVRVNSNQDEKLNILQKLRPVIQESRSVQLSDCGIADEGCVVLASVLRSKPSHLRELNLSVNKLGDSGIKLLAPGLKNPKSKLEILRLSTCDITDEGCAALASALRSNPSHVKHLDLSENKLGDSGVKQLFVELKNPRCKLEILKLMKCGVTEEGCAALALALSSNPSHLKELTLSRNPIGNSGVTKLSDSLKSSLCKLETLKLGFCEITDEGCAALASALRSNTSHLRELNLSENKLGDSGVKRLSAVLEVLHCKLEILKLWDCSVTDEGCFALTSALRSNPSHLKHLDLSRNNLESAVTQLSQLQDHPHFKLERLYM